MSGITTAASMKEWKADVPCCTTRPYDHVHPEPVGPPPAEFTDQELVEIEEVWDSIPTCGTCGSAGVSPCFTAGGREKETWHKVRPVTETEEEDESETDE